MLVETEWLCKVPCDKVRDQLQSFGVECEVVELVAGKAEADLIDAVEVEL